jgi:hypothetical protein
MTYCRYNFFIRPYVLSFEFFSRAKRLAMPSFHDVWQPMGLPDLRMSGAFYCRSELTAR